MIPIIPPRERLPQGWGLYQEPSSWNPFTSDVPYKIRDLTKGGGETVRVDVIDGRMIKPFAKGRDIQWVYDGWAVDFSWKYIWIDHSDSDDAAKVLGDIIDALHAAGKKTKWASYDVDLLGNNIGKKNIGNESLVTSMKDFWPKSWKLLTDGSGIDPAKLSPTSQRRILQLWYLEWSKSFDSIRALVDLIPTSRAAPRVIGLIEAAKTLEAVDTLIKNGGIADELK
jgi:hypothetical protein